MPNLNACLFININEKGFLKIVSLICYEKWNIFCWLFNSLVISRVIALATMNGCAYDLVNLYQAGSIEHTHENVDKYKKNGKCELLV